MANTHASNEIPLMFQAQIEGRCNLQYVQNTEIVEEWVKQWKEAAQAKPKFGKQVETKTYDISWRLVTNGGQDDGIIRPVISGNGLPFYPGSSMKGAFRQACATDCQRDRYCGKKLEDGKFQPGILRFHGGYPVNKWDEKLLDVVHPQQDFQVKNNSKHSAYALISLYQPEIKFSISSTKPEETDWKEVWPIWEKALGAGIGCRVSSGYGQPVKLAGDVLYQVELHGEGATSKLLNGELEFRPNIFRAALRGHALRIFGGLNQSLAEDVVDELFGGIRSGKEKVGLLGMAFHPEHSEWRSTDGKEAYDVTGTLIWMLSGKLDNPEHRPLLKILVEKLTQFAMLLGGFGKSWRRADHRKFYPKYTKHLIGCHWEWLNDEKNSVKVNSLESAKLLIEEVLKVAREWMQKRGFEVLPPATAQLPTPTPPQNDPKKPQLKRPTPRPIKPTSQAAIGEEWREAWRSDNVQVWGRIAKNAGNSKNSLSMVIPWLHSPENKGDQPPQRGGYKNAPSQTPPQSNPSALQRPSQSNNQLHRPSIYRTDVTGRVSNDPNKPTQIGRIWHRMYPLGDEQYLELITIFYKSCKEAEDFVAWLASSKSGFHQVW